MIAFPQVFFEARNKECYVAYDPLTGEPTSWANKDAIISGHVWGHDWMRRSIYTQKIKAVDTNGKEIGTFWNTDLAPPICWSKDLWSRKPYVEKSRKESSA